MSKISKTQLIKDCADAYRTASGTSAAVRYDELAGKIEELSTGGSAYPINVTFQIPNGTTPETYTEHTKVGIKENGKIAEPTTPTPPTTGMILDGWYDGQTKIVFPYSPSTDKTLNAVFGYLSLLTVNNPICTDYYGGYPASKAFDNDISTRWAARDGAGGIGADFTKSTFVTYVKCIRGDEGWFEDIQLQYSDDSTIWLNASERIEHPVYDEDNITTINSTVNTSHRYWRVYCYGVATVNEMQFYGYTPTQQSITVSNAGETVGVFRTAANAYFTVSKLRNGLAVAGYYYYGDNLVGCMLVSQTDEGTWQSDGDNTSVSFTYDGETWYYQNLLNVLHNATPASPAKSSGAAHNICNYATLPSDISEIATDLLDYYYSLDE